MPWRTAGTSARYVGELVIPEALDAVLLNLPFKTASENSQRWIVCPLAPAPVSFHKGWLPDRTAVAEYWATNCLVCRWKCFFVADPSKAGQCFQHIIALLHFYCDIVAVCVNMRWVSSVTLNTFGFYSSGNTWSAVFTCGCKWCSWVSGVKSVTVDLAVDTASFFLYSWALATDRCWGHWLGQPPLVRMCRW